MPTPTLPARPLHAYKVLTFDVYGTLVDYKPAIYAALRPILHRAPPASPWRQTDADADAAGPPSNPSTSTSRAGEGDGEGDGDDAENVRRAMASSVGARLLTLFKTHEDRLMLGRPLRPFRHVLRDIYLGIARDIGVPADADAEGLEAEVERFGGAIGELPVYADTVGALRRLGEEMGVRLVAVSNVEEEASGVTFSQDPGLGEVQWWRTFSSSDFVDRETGVLDRNADRRKLEFLRAEIPKLYENETGEELGAGGWLHVANSLGHDHVPCKELGMGTVWVVREAVRWGKESEMKGLVEQGRVGYGWRFAGLREFVEAFEKSAAQDG